MWVIQIQQHTKVLKPNLSLIIRLWVKAKNANKTAIMSFNWQKSAKWQKRSLFRHALEKTNFKWWEKKKWCAEIIAVRHKNPLHVQQSWPIKDQLSLILFLIKTICDKIKCLETHLVFYLFINFSIYNYVIFQ